MGNKVGGFSKAQVNALSKNLINEVIRFKSGVTNVEKAVTALQKGDDNGPYWNGELAYKWVKACLAHIDHDKVLLDHLDNCAEYFETLVKNGNNL